MGPGKSPRDGESLSSASSFLTQSDWHGADTPGAGDPPGGPARSLPDQPARITAIHPHHHRPARFVVEVDGRPALVLSLDGIERLGLAEGQLWDPRSEVAVREGTVLEAFDRAARSLALRDRSSSSLARLLTRKGIDREAAQAAIERLRAAGFIDDEAYARRFARSRAASGVARGRIAAELFREGISRDAANAAIAETFEAERIDEGAIVEAAAARKFRSLGGLPPRKQRARLWAFLARRGYPMDAIRRAVNLTLDGASASEGSGDTEAPEPEG
jgi:regulatory protein